MFEMAKEALDEDAARLLLMTKSASGVQGPPLAEAHMELGRMLARFMDIDPQNTTVVAILRSGLFFAQGIYLEAGCKFDVFWPGLMEFKRPATRDVILADAVINTGKTIEPLLADERTRIACCVISEDAVPRLEGRLYAARVSGNSYIGGAARTQQGGKGPDTTLRLFNQL